MHRPEDELAVSEPGKEVGKPLWTLPRAPEEIMLLQLAAIPDNQTASMFRLTAVAEEGNW